MAKTRRSRDLGDPIDSDFVVTDPEKFMADVSKPGHAIDQGSNAVEKSFDVKETRDDADGFFGDGIADASFCCQLPYQLVHLAPPHPVTCRILACDFILIMCDAKYKR